MRTAVNVGCCWQTQTGSGRITFPLSPGGSIKFKVDRYGVFAQISYRLSDLGADRTFSRFRHAGTDLR
jgi:hypothetical protein